MASLSSCERTTWEASPGPGHWACREVTELLTAKSAQFAQRRMEGEMCGNMHGWMDGWMDR